MEAVERRLEMCMPDEELPEAEEIVRMISKVEPITAEAKDILVSLMEHTVEMHFRATQAAEKFSALA